MEINNTPGRLERIAKTAGTVLLRTTGAVLMVGGAVVTAGAGIFMYDSFNNPSISANEVLPVAGFGSMFGIAGLETIYIGTLMLLPKGIRDEATNPNNYL